LIARIVIAGHTSNIRGIDAIYPVGGMTGLSDPVLIATPGAGSKAVTVEFSTITGSFALVASATELNTLTIEDIGVL
jgi:hypothetical protein